MPSHVISRKLSTGPHGPRVAQSRPVMDSSDHGSIVIPITDEAPRIAVKPRRIVPKDDKVRRLTLECDQLRRDLSRLSDRIRRLYEEVEWEAKWWQQGLDKGFQRESIDSVKRRISRLRGALAYLGIVGNVTAEREL